MEWDPRKSWRTFNEGLGGYTANFSKHFGHFGAKLNDFYDHTPVRIAEFKRDNITSKCDERVRLIILSILSIPIWKISNYRSGNAPLLRYRNLALTFVGLGVILSPEIFNPFLSEYRTAPTAPVLQPTERPPA